MNLAEWAARAGVNKHTAYRWFREGTLPVPARRVGRLILVELPGEHRRAARTVVYARVSSPEQRSDLARQVDRLADEVTARGLSVDEVVREVGSGVNGRRPKLRRVLSDPSATTVVVEHRDRLARFGVEHLEAALAAQGRRLLVAEEAETSDDLVPDMVEVLTSFCARRYGRRGARDRALRAVTCAGNPDPDPVPACSPGGGGR